MSDSTPTTTTNQTAADGSTLPPLPANHLNHPENWATGVEPATEKQKGFIAVLEKQHPELTGPEGIEKEKLDKSEASAVIDKLKNGKALEGKEEKKEDVEMSEEKDTSTTTAVPVDTASTSKKEEAQVGDKRKTTVEDHTLDNKENEKTKNGVNGENQSTKDTSTSTATDEVEKDQTTLDNHLSSPDSHKKKKPRTSEVDTDTSKTSKKSEGSKQSMKSTDTVPSKHLTVETDQSTTTTKDKSTASSPLSPLLSSPPPEGNELLLTPKLPETTNNTSDQAVSPMITKDTNNDDETVPGDGEHLDHPENWATGGEPATDKQKGFLHVLEKQKGVNVNGIEGMGKSEASEKIDELKKA